MIKYKLGKDVFSLQAFWSENTGYFGEAKDKDGKTIATTDYHMKDESEVFSVLRATINNMYKL